MICDDTDCYLFFSDTRGRFHRTTTSRDEFPEGFDEPVIVMQDSNAGRMSEASNVYRVNGTNQYLALIEALDQTSDGHGYFRSWIADSLDGTWLPWQASGSYPFASSQTVTFEGDAWTNDISHGDMLRAGYDEKLEIDPYHLRYVFQGPTPRRTTAATTKPYPGRSGS